MPADNSLVQIFTLLQFADTALPVGGFSFSNSLESAVAYGVVSDVASLEEFVLAALQVTATTDCIAARVAHEGCVAARLDVVAQADEELLLRKLNAEQRLMSLRMGRKLAELASQITDDIIVKKWQDMISAGDAAGTYATTLGVVGAVSGIGEREVFCAMIYGTATMMLNAALRLMRLTHYSTQRILHRLSSRVEVLYAQSALLGLKDMYGFAPQIDMLSSLHERGHNRMFMN